MFRPLRSRLILAAIAACTVLAGPIVIAQASNATLLSTFKQYNAAVTRDELAVARGLQQYKPGRAGPAIHALRHEVGDIHGLIGRLRGQSASTARGRRGKTQIIHGLNLIARAYGTLASDLRKASSGKRVSRSELKATVRSDKQGRRELIAGLKKVSRRR